MQYFAMPRFTFLLSVFFFFASLTKVPAQDTNFKGSCYGCTLLKNIDQSLHVINDSTDWLMRHGFDYSCDSCFYGMVDTLKARFISTSKTKYIKTLSNLAKNSDGAYSEYFENADILYKNFKPSCDYFYNSKDTGALFFCLIRELMFEMYYGYAQPDTAKISEIQQFIKKQESLYHIKDGEKTFIDSFIGRAKQEEDYENNSTQEEN